jgi:hypothetical protein
MSEYIQLEPKGIMLYKYNPERKKYVRQRPKKLSILTHLRDECKIKEGTTLKDIFHGVEKYKLLKLIISQYSWCKQIDEFHAQAEEPMRDDPTDTDPLRRLEIYWCPEVHLYNETIKHIGGHKTKIRTACFDSYCGFHGIGPAPKGKEDNPAYRTEDGCIQYSVSYSPMWKLADLPVNLNKEFTIYEPYPYKEKQPANLLKAEKEFSLLDVLDAIYYDISFMGGPAENAEFIEEMGRRMEEIDSGTVKTIPWEDVKKELGLDKEDEEENKKEEGKYKIKFHPDVASALGFEEENEEEKNEEEDE